MLLKKQDLDYSWEFNNVSIRNECVRQYTIQDEGGVKIAVDELQADKSRLRWRKPSERRF